MTLPKGLPPLDLPPPAKRMQPRTLRAVGLVTLVLGLAGASVSYWVRTRNLQPTAEDLIPGLAAEEQRQQAIMYGQMAEDFLELFGALARPDVQAVTLVLMSGIVGGLCFRAARRREQDGGNGVPEPSSSASEGP